MKEYLDVLQHVYEYGNHKPGRNGGTRELFGIATRYNNIGEHFPLLTTKKMAWKGIVGELLSFLRGCDDVKQFNKLGCNIWDANATSDYWKVNPNYEKGYLGRIYGVQWRDWTRPSFDENGNPVAHESIDQILNLVDDLKNNKYSRRHLVTAWNPGELDEMCLPPCHVLWQCNVNTDDTLDLLMFQRSCDMFLGVPFNIASYSLLMLILCELTGLKPGSFIHMMGSAHIYEAHLEAVEEIITRLPGPPCQVKVKNRKQKTVDEFKPSDFSLVGYNPQDPIKAEMIV